MKQIIDGKVYNTETATEVGAEYSNGLGCSDFRNVTAQLYKTKNGRFFLAGEGGAMSIFSQPCGNMTGGGEGIIAMTKEEALEWAETHEVGPDDIEKHFSDIIEEA